MKTVNLIGGVVFFTTAFMLLSCSKFYEDRIPEADETADDCLLTVRLNGGRTKVSGQTTADENALNNVSVFVFRTEPGARLDASLYVNLSSAGAQAGGGAPCSVSLKCTSGDRRIYVLANTASDLTADIECEDDLLGHSSLLKDNGLKNFFMMGSVDTTVNGSTFNVGVEISRFVSCVRLEKITNLMEAKVYRANGLFVVNDIYLTNVVGKMNFDGTHNPSGLAPEYWYAKLEAEKNPLFYDGDMDEAVNYGEDNARAVTHSFYAFPNDCTLSESPTWSQRSTMLVIEATLDGVKYYYPVAVGPLEANKQYVITNFTIRRPGSLNPWGCVNKTVASIEIKVADWGTSISRTEDL